MRWTGHVARIGDERIAYKILAGIPVGKRPLGRPRRRWVNNIWIKWGGNVVIGLIRRRTGTNGGPLWTRYWSFVFHKVVFPVFNWAPRHRDVLEKWRYSTTHSLTSVLGRGEVSASRSGCFTPGIELPISIRWEAGWTPEPVWARYRSEKFPASSGNRTPIIRSSSP
jgi:hypothetical protein